MQILIKLFGQWSLFFICAGKSRSKSGIFICYSRTSRGFMRSWLECKSVWAKMSSPLSIRPFSPTRGKWWVNQWKKFKDFLFKTYLSSFTDPEQPLPLCTEDCPRSWRGWQGQGGECLSIPRPLQRHCHLWQLLHRRTLRRCQVRSARPEDWRQLQGLDAQITLWQLEDQHWSVHLGGNQGRRSVQGLDWWDQQDLWWLGHLQHRGNKSTPDSFGTCPWSWTSQVMVAKDGKEYIIEVNDSATTLMGESQEEDRKQIADLVVRHMEVRDWHFKF